MNPQIKRKNGVIVSRGIGWCTHTHNPIGGCFHDCKWKMPDGQIAKCYAGDAARGAASGQYPNGFEYHYWRPDHLDDPLKYSEPAHIFIDSMSDLCGEWVPEDQILLVLDMIKRAHWHIFQSLTKNAPRLLKFADKLPPNLWVGASTPPDFFLGHELNQRQKDQMLDRTLGVLTIISGYVPVTWLSIEPLSWDVSEIISQHKPLKWAVIGAASNGKTKYQPEPGRVQKLHDVLDAQGVPVWHKQNLIWSPHREYWPGMIKSEFMQMYEAELEADRMPPMIV